MTTEHDERGHTDEADAFIAQVAAHYTPPPLTPARRVAFDRALAERIARRRQAAFRRSAVSITAVCCAAVLLWVAARSSEPVAPTAGKPGESVVIEEAERLAADETTLLLLAYESAELSDADGDGGEEDFLPPEYTGLAAALDFPGEQ